MKKSIADEVHKLPLVAHVEIFQLDQTVGTVKTHIKSIYGKLGVHSRTQAIARAREVGLL